MELYEAMRCAGGNCGQHPISHNDGVNHCEDCNDEDDLKYANGIKINHVSCGGAKCRYSLDQWDSTPLYCIECYGPENENEDLQTYIITNTDANE